MMYLDDGKKEKLNRIIKYAVASAIALLLAFLLGLFEQLGYEGVKFPFLRLCCDGCFVSGVLYLATGGLAYISEHGGFDAISYALHMIKNRFVHPNPEYREKDYYDYITRKKKNRKARKVLYLVIIGAVLIIAAAIMVPFVPDFDPEYA